MIFAGKGVSWVIPARSRALLRRADDAGELSFHYAVMGREHCIVKERLISMIVLERDGWPVTSTC